LKLDPFYLVLDSAEGFERMLACGVKLIQLRIKHRPDAELRSEIMRGRELCAAYGAQFVINDHWRLAIELGCDFVHLGQADLETADLPAIRAAGLKFGVSTENERELDKALALGADCIALQPVFDTSSKQIDCPPQGLPMLGAWKKRMGNLPLIAIGGVTLERAGSVYEAGADCAAVIGDVAGAAQPEQRARAWVETTRRLIGVQIKIS
jgi:thiamine-phosphate pyrophosphorylase